MEEKKKYKTFEEMYLCNYKLIYAFIRDYTEDWYLAEEIASIVWAKIAECPNTYLEKDIKEFQNYLRVMVKNEAIQQFRVAERQNKKTEKAAVLLSPTRTVEDEYVLREELKSLATARSLLSEEENRLLDLRFDRNFTVKQTGEALGLNISAVKMRQCRILAKLRKLME